VTSSLDRNVDPFKIMGITRHVKVDTLKEYDRRESGFDDHAGEDQICRSVNRGFPK
jgi:hypothetical protein